MPHVGEKKTRNASRIANISLLDVGQNGDDLPVRRRQHLIRYRQRGPKVMGRNPILRLMPSGVAYRLGELKTWIIALVNCRHL